MNEFRILTKEKSPIEIVQALPADMSSLNQLVAAERVMAKGDFGQMVFQCFKGEGFDIWFSNYRIAKQLRFFGATDDPVLEFHSQFFNSFSAAWTGMGNINSYHRQYQLTFMKQVETMGEFPSGKPADSFDIHFKKETLYPYAAYCTRLGHFLEKVEAGITSNLLDIVCFLSPGMEEAITAMIEYNMHEGLAGQYYKGKVHELLVNMVHHIGEMDKKPEFDPSEIHKAEEAKKIILENFAVYDTVEELAAKVGTKEHKLQLAFKYRFGTTVAKFSREARMKKAHELLNSSDDILLSVALAVGFNDTGNFSTAFKAFFKYSPGEVQKRKRRQGCP